MTGRGKAVKYLVSRGRHLLGAGLACLLVACGPFVQTPRSPRATSMIDAAKSEGIVLADPSVLDDEAVQSLKRHIGYEGLPRERMARVLAYLHGGRNRFQHSPGLTISA